MVQASFLRGLLISIGEDSIGVSLNPFTSGRSRAFLNDVGWLLNIPMEPTMDPVHGEGIGRQQGEESPQAPGVLQRLAYAAVALIIFILFVAWRMSHAPGSAFAK
jgi:hypothetical protein